MPSLLSVFLFAHCAVGHSRDFGCCIYPSNLAAVVALVPVLAFLSISRLPYIQVRNVCYTTTREG